MNCKNNHGRIVQATHLVTLINPFGDEEPELHTMCEPCTIQAMTDHDHVMFSTLDFFQAVALNNRLGTLS